MKCCYFTFFVMNLLGVCRSGEEEHRLIRDLMTRYNRLERPVKNESESLSVSLQISLQQIINVDAQDQIVDINAYQQFRWKDYKLKWNPAEYNGITSLRFPVGYIWKPDVLLYNSVDEAFDTKYGCNHIVYWNGNVEWMPPGMLRFSCRIDITWFPFDDQVCHLKFGSWTYSSKDLDLQPFQKSGMDTTVYINNSAWELLATPVERREDFYECCPDEPYPSLFYYIVIRRKLLFYTINLIIPSVLISLMTILGFALPNDSGEKVTLEITILLTISFFLTMLKDMTPASSDAIPLLGAYFSSCMLLVSASVVMTVLTLNIHHRRLETHTMGKLTRTILLHWLPWFLMMKHPTYKFIRPDLYRTHAKKAKLLEKGRKKLSHASSLEGTCNGSAIQTDVYPYSIAHSFNQQTNMLHFPLDHGTDADKTLVILLSLQHRELKRIAKSLEAVERRVCDDEEAELAENEWRFAAIVVDRLCLYTFTIFMLFSTVVVICSAPHFGA